MQKPNTKMSDKTETPAATKRWARNDDLFRLMEHSEILDSLPLGIYKLDFHPMKGFWLERTADEFAMPVPMYGAKADFIARVCRTFKSRRENMGIKGTGKTVTCKKIANSIGQPVIVVDGNMPGLCDFIASIPQGVTYFFDEFEKKFKQNDSNDNGDTVNEAGANLLSLLDGVLSNDTRNLFLFTTNNRHVNDNLLQRPGRVRYILEFGNLEPDQIEEIVDDRLAHAELREKVITFIGTLETITIDIVTAVIDEVNIHREDPKDYAVFFNVEQLRRSYDVKEITRENPTGVHLAFNVKSIQPDPGKGFTKDYEGHNFGISHETVGKIKEVLSPEVILVDCHETDYKRKIVTLPGKPKKRKLTTRKFKVAAVIGKHYDFKGANHWPEQEAVL